MKVLWMGGGWTVLSLSLGRGAAFVVPRRFCHRGLCEESPCRGRGLVPLHGATLSLDPSEVTLI